MNEPKKRAPVDMLHQLGDELGLQAWLAGAEIRNPSLKQEGVRQELDALARLRDELRVQLHLGRLEGAEEFERLEGQWWKIKSAATRAVDDLGEGLRETLADIREGYRRLLPG
jgi:hypothetical protein